MRMNIKLFGIVAVVIILGAVLFALQERTSPSAVASQTVELKDGDVYDLTAGYVTKVLAGKAQKMLAYNLSIPGPTIRVPQGASVTVNFKNDTDLPALLHSHGVRMDNAFDGSQLQQKDIQPGESFTYKLTFPDAGVYWYHPHVAEVYGQGLGLYGAFIVTPTDPTYFPPVDREVPLFLSDLPVQDGNIMLDKDNPSHSLMGHYGNVMLVNGQEDYVLEAKKNEVVRLYIINAANVRPFNFAIKGAKLKIIGGDSGAYERATWQDSVLLAPSERAIVDVLFENAGTYTIQNQTPDKTYALGTIKVSADTVATSYVAQFNTLQENKTTKTSIDPFRSYFDKAPDKHVALTIDMTGGMMSGAGGGHMMPDGSMMPASPDGIEWEDTNPMMNAMSNTAMIKWKIVDQDTGKKDMDIDWNFNKGEPVKIRIFNDPKSAHPMQHPIHFHGQRFLVVARDGARQENLVWKDTVLVKAGETVDIVLDPSSPGTWMAHCHISEHLEAGMMMKFTVK